MRRISEVAVDLRATELARQRRHPLINFLRIVILSEAKDQPLRSQSMRLTQVAGVGSTPEQRSCGML